MVAEWKLGVVQRVDLGTGTVTPWLTGLENPVPVVAPADGSVLVGDWGTGKVYRVTAVERPPRRRVTFRAVLPRSTMPHVSWPAVPDPNGALLLALMFQLGESEYLDPEVVERRQLDALHRLLRHSARTVPYYRDTPGYVPVAGLPRLTADDWRRVPILTRAALQEAGAGLHSAELPAEHEPVTEVCRAGSTGPPVRVLGTKVTGLFWQAITLRDMLWHGRDMGRKLAAIRADRADQIPPEGLVLPNWAPFLEAAYPTGAVRHPRASPTTSPPRPGGWWPRTPSTS